MNIEYSKLFLNKLDVVKIDGYYKPERFSKKQKESFKNQRDVLAVQTEYTSGILLEFISNTSSVSFDYKTGYGNETFANFDIFIDDEYHSSISCSNYNYFEYKFNFSCNNSLEKKISIYFPHSASIMIKDFKLDNEASFKYSELKKQTLLCYGDSITQGYASLFPKNTYPALLSKKLKMNLINQGVAGAYHDYNTFDEELNLNPSIVISAYGTNDWSFIERLDQLKENIENYLSLLHKQYDEIPVFIITPIWRGSYLQVNSFGTLFDVISILIKASIKYDNFTIIDGLELTPHDESYFDESILHPNEKCFKIYANNLYEQIIKSIK